ncbi:ribonucleases P/MRP protein subunit POP1 [Camponotus floridanus]|uniref:ribonucleases P/MRP protein subunit POP1 n=1 Tax=Camponotus floridanus TaxID=104421 RepID=UPI000DC682F9|nr:ribonucleases P/MRP protein subunit POP1 [Camponotus floridanus]
MAKKRKQFDEYLGGSETLPSEVNIMHFVSSRAREISAMTSSIENPKQTKLIFQKLPVYMRRRVMSHNVKRLPRRLREAHSAQMAKSANGQNLPSTNKRPSRKYRRRPRNLLSEYYRRQRKKIWLETHIWHAKRFHMIDKWGYKIPNYSNDKSFRASYRATTQNCLLQDISYYTCIEIVGEKNWLEATLKEHCNPRKTFTAEMYTSGQKEGTVMFFKRNGYPQFPIGNVDFFWKLSETDIKTIWIWVHPAFYSDFLSEIISSFEFKQNNAEQDRTDILHHLNDLYTNDAGCKMLVLRYALNRFRLSGPAALTVLGEALYVPSLTELDLDSENCPMREEQDSSLNDEKLDTTSTGNNVSVQPVEKMVIDENEKDTKDLTIQDLKKKMWYNEYYNERENIEAFKIQEQLWQSMKVLGSPSFLLSNMIIGLTVLDPRFYLPVKRTKTEIPSSAKNLDCQLPTDLNRSPIWDAQIRHIVSNSCVSTDRINKLRSECLVPGMSNDQYFSKDVMAKIPILLVQKPAAAPLGLGSRIDIIIPSRWAMAFWIALIMRCARVGALRESKLIAFESLATYVPDINDPDTPAYTREALMRKEELINKYFSYPPNRRNNFIKFGIHSPFFCDWKNLTKGWSDVEDFHVLRHFRPLALLKIEIEIPVKRKNARSKSTVQESEFNFQEFDEYKNCLVQVQLSMMGKGTPEEFAIICMPTHEDLEGFENNKKYAGPLEKCHIDPNEKSRKILRKEHLMQLKRLRRRRVERKKKLQDNVLPEEFDVIHDTINCAKLSEHRKMISDYAKEMRKLYLPESTEVRHSCDREVMGYVTIGGYSFLRAKGIGIGYVTLPSLLEIIRKKSNFVLVRNTKKRQYRLAQLDILLDF